MHTNMAAHAHTHTQTSLHICSIIHGSLATPTHPATATSACCNYVYLFHVTANSAAALQLRCSPSLKKKIPSRNITPPAGDRLTINLTNEGKDKLLQRELCLSVVT